MELVTYFQGLLGRIEPSAGHVAKAKAAHEQLRERLRNDDEVSKAHKDTYLSGSYARHTAIRDIKDVDVICLLDLNTKVTEPIVLLRWLESRLLEYYDKVAVQGRSIGITSQQGVDLDVVPGASIGSDDGPMELPDRDAAIWVDSHPKGQIAFARQRNADTGGYYVQVVKLIKYWRDRLSPPALETKSYVAEALVARTMGATPPGSHARAVVTVLEGIVREYGAWAGTGQVPTVPDPGYPSKNVSKRWKSGEFDAFVTAARAASVTAKSALEETNENTSTDLWRKVFGSWFAPPA